MSFNSDSLSEIADVIDSLHKTPKYSAIGRSMVRATDVKYGPLRLEATHKVDEDVFNEFSRRYKPSIGDIVITRVGSYGNTAYVEDIDFCLGQNTSAIIPKIHPRYLFLVLNSPQVKQQIEASVVGSTQKTLSLKALLNLRIPRFAQEYESFIARVGGKLDDKIQLNQQINQTLEQIAQALFKSWFVDFDPVKAKIEVLEAGGSEEEALLAAMQVISSKNAEELAAFEVEKPKEYAQLRATAELFPAAMVGSELGVIPEGWDVRTFKELCDKVESGGTPKRSESEYWGGDIKWLSSGEVRDVVVLDTKEKITAFGLENSSAKLWPIYTTVVAMYGATAGQVCLLANEMTANQACCALVPKDNCKAFVFIAARRSIANLADKASGSAQQNLNKGLVESHSVISPSENMLEAYELIALPLLLKWIENIQESLALSQLRDSLLPKLLSGELDVSELAESLEAEA